jgi:cytochrome d ubiquinol oxidase subunit II
MGIDLPMVWAVIILFGVMMYVVMDGFDLGIGLLFPFFRGVAFEFRFKASAARRGWWDKAFIGGSLLATFCQGVVLGAFISGVPVVDGRYAGGGLDWLTPFALFTGAGLVATYAMLGATWLIMKTDGLLQLRMRLVARTLAWVLLLFIAAISLWTPLVLPQVAVRWFTWPNLAFFAPVPLLVLASMIGLKRSLATAQAGRNDSAPFFWTLALVFLGYSGLGISLWPNIVPPSLSIQAAAGPPQSLGFALVGALLIIPLILMYTAWGYWVFRGKVRRGDGYH